MISRPESLADVAHRASNAREFEFEPADFLHQFALQGHDAMLTGQTLLFRDRCGTGAVLDAYLAAVAVSLASGLGCPAPALARHPERILREPWFARPGRHMRALLLVESPAAFRERNLFVSANALSVA